MVRTVYTNPFPRPPAKVAPDLLVVTPHSAAAETLGVQRVSLYGLARDLLGASHLGVATADESFALLRQAISAVDPEADAAALAKRTRKILQTLLRTGIDIDDLETYGSEQAKQVARIAREYERSLGEHALVDHSAVLWRAGMLDPEPRPLFVYGYFRARKEEIAFINAFAGEDSVYCLPCGTDPIFETNNSSAEWLRSIGGWHIDGDASVPTDTGTKMASRFINADGEAQVTALLLDNLDAEVRHVLGKAKHLIVSSAAPRDVAVVCGDSEIYGPLLATVAEEYGVGVDLRGTIALRDTLTGSFVESLLRANETEFEFEAAAALFMHAFGPGLTAYEWKAARKHRVSGTEEWSKLSPHLTCLAWQMRFTRKEWTDCLLTTLRTLDVRRKAGPISREVIAFDLLTDSLRAASSANGSDLIGPSEFCSAIREMLVTTRVPLQPSRGGVPIHDLDTIQGSKYKHLFIIGMAEGILPPPVADNPVIDFYERAVLAHRGIEFEEAAEVARWAALSFYSTLLAAGDSLTLSFPIAIENQQKIPSAYFARMGIDPEAPCSKGIYCSGEELRQLIRSDAEDEELLPLARKQLSVEATRESVSVADEYDGVIGIAIDPLSRSWSASQFTVLGQCPYRWFAQKLLELKEAQEADTSLSPATKGTLYHKTLELAVECSRDSGDLRTAVLDVLDDCFAQAEADPDVGLPVLENWPLQRSEHQKALRKAVSSSKFLEEGAEVISLEARFEAVWNGMTISGRVDRIDRGPGGLAAIDYKTSSSAPQGVKDDKGKSKVDIQLALYTQVALPHLYPGETVEKGLYYSLTKGKVLRTIEADKMPPLEELVDKIHSVMHQGRFAVDPDTDFNACKYCEFDAMCRKGTRLARKERIR